VNYPALADGASWFNKAAIAASPQALLPAVPAVDFRRIAIKGGYAIPLTAKAVSPLA